MVWVLCLYMVLFSVFLGMKSSASVVVYTMSRNISILMSLLPVLYIRSNSLGHCVCSLFCYLFSRYVEFRISCSLYHGKKHLNSDVSTSGLMAWGTVYVHCFVICFLGMKSLESVVVYTMARNISILMSLQPVRLSVLQA